MHIEVFVDRSLFPYLDMSTIIAIRDWESNGLEYGPQKEMIIDYSFIDCMFNLKSQALLTSEFLCTVRNKCRQ